LLGLTRTNQRDVEIQFMRRFTLRQILAHWRSLMVPNILDGGATYISLGELFDGTISPRAIALLNWMLKKTTENLRGTLTVKNSYGSRFVLQGGSSQELNPSQHPISIVSSAPTSSSSAASSSSLFRNPMPYASHTHRSSSSSSSSSSLTSAASAQSVSFNRYTARHFSPFFLVQPIVVQDYSFFPPKSGPGSRGDPINLGRRRGPELIAGTHYKGSDLRRLIEDRLRVLHRVPNVPGDFQVLTIDETVKVFNTYSVGEDLFGREDSSSRKRSHVLVRSDDRNIELNNELHEMKYAYDQAIDPKVEPILHPGKILCFLEVNFTVIDASQDLVSALSLNSSIYSLKTHFAVVNFFAPHPCRYSWQFGSVFEVWSAKPSRYNKSKSNLVCVTELAGKFYPGLFDDNEGFHSVSKKKERLGIGKHPLFSKLSENYHLNFEVPQAMAVLHPEFRCPYAL